MLYLNIGPIQLKFGELRALSLKTQHMVYWQTVYRTNDIACAKWPPRHGKEHRGRSIGLITKLKCLTS